MFIGRRIAIRSVSIAHECAEGVRDGIAWGRIGHDSRVLELAHTFADELANAIGWGLALGCIAAAAVD